MWHLCGTLIGSNRASNPFPGTFFPSWPSFHFYLVPLLFWFSILHFYAFAMTTWIFIKKISNLRIRFSATFWMHGGPHCDMQHLRHLTCTCILMAGFFFLILALELPIIKPPKSEFEIFLSNLELHGLCTSWSSTWTCISPLASSFYYFFLFLFFS